MSDPFALPPGLPAPGADARAHGERVLACIRERIGRSGPIPFVEYMDFCLNAPALGYYAAGSGKFGAEGDFVTAPELSPLFARVVARQFDEILQRLDGGEIVEIGGGTGAFARDSLAALAELGRASVRYRILETSAELRDRQQERLSGLGVEWLDALPDEPFDGIIFANEVADALPVECFRVVGDGELESVHVDVDGKAGLRLVGLSAGERLRDHVAGVEARLGRRLGAGYHSEWCPSLGFWLEALAAPLRRGAMLIIDYGYGEAEYYHPERSGGTLGCHYRHHWHADPLLLPGLQDLTASVDFSVLARAGRALGFELFGFTTQAWFLLECGLATEMEAAARGDDPVRYAELAGAARRLTLPGEMGERFRVLGFGRGLAGAELIGFGGRRLDDAL